MLNPKSFANSRPDGIGVLEIVDDNESRPDQPRLFVPLKRTELNGAVTGPLAALRLTQTYGFTSEQCEKTLEAVYRDAYFSQLNDRYGQRWHHYEALAAEQRRRYFEGGLRMVSRPVRRPSHVSAEIAEGLTSAATYWLTATFLDAEGRESAPSAAVAAIPGPFTVVDSTFATPIVQQPLEHGADLVLHAATKGLGGHNDALLGVIAGARELVEAVWPWHLVSGAQASPFDALNGLRGIRTLAVRVRQHNESALRIARFLESHPKIERVYYPGLESHPDHEVARRLCSGFGGMVSFLVRGGLSTTSRFIDRCKLPIIAPSMGGVETLMEQPALMSFYELTSEQRQAIGIAENLVRLSVGLENADDLIGDFAQSLDGL